MDHGWLFRGLGLVDDCVLPFMGRSTATVLRVVALHRINVPRLLRFYALCHAHAHGPGMELFTARGVHPQ